MRHLQCPRCGHTFTKPNDLDRHVNRKVACEPKVADVDPRGTSVAREESQKHKRFGCEWCSTALTSQQSLDRHRTICSKRGTLDNANAILSFIGGKPLSAADVATLSNSEVLRLISDTVRALQSRAGTPTEQATTSTTVTGDNNQVHNHQTVNSNNVTNVTVNVTVDFGSEDVRLSLEELESLLRVHPINAVKDLVEKTHFSSESGRNWFVCNIKDRKAKVLCQNRWVPRDATEVVYEVFDKHRNVIDETCDKARNEEGELSDNFRRRVSRWERESSRDDFEDLCQEKVKNLGYANNPKFRR